MNRTDRRSIERLPFTVAPWEIGILRGQLTVEGPPMEGILVVAEAGAGAVRAAGPLVIGGLAALLMDAMLQRAGGSFVPARPPRVLCDDAGIEKQLRAELQGTGIPVDRAKALPAAQAAIDDLVRKLGPAMAAPVPAPGFDTDLAAWSGALLALGLAEPWRSLNDTVAFRFAGKVPALADAVAIVLGRAGKQAGVVLFHSAADHERFRASSRAGGGFSPEMACTVLYVDPADQLPAADRRRCEAAGMTVPGGRLPRLMHVEGGGTRPVERTRARTFLAALQAVVVLCGRDPARLAEGEHELRVQTALGVVDVRVSGDLPLHLVREVTQIPATPRSTLLSDVEHACWLDDEAGADAWSEHPVLFFQAYKADATRLAAALGGTDAVRVEGTVADPILVAYERGVRKSAVAPLRYVTARALAGLAGRSVTLFFAKGGVSRSSISLRDRVGRWDVRVEPAADGITATSVADRLIALSDDLRRGRPLRDAPRAIAFAAEHWYAAICADHHGDPLPVAELFTAAELDLPSIEWTQEMLADKREWFGADRRFAHRMTMTVDEKGVEVVVYSSEELPDELKSRG